MLNSLKYIIKKNNLVIQKLNKNQITVKGLKKNLTIKLKQSTINYYDLNYLLRIFRKYIYLLNDNFFIELSIKGLGYHVMKLKNKLRFALGHDHFIFITVPESVVVFTKKNNLILLGSDSEKINNFANTIIKLKPISAYKEQGIYKTNRKLKFKIGKQIKN